MIDLTNLTELFCKHPFGKVLQGLIIALMLLMFFEQHTDTFKLARLNKAAEVVQKTESNSAKAAISEQIQNELRDVLNPRPSSSWWERMIGGWVLFFFISLLWCKSDRLAVLRINLLGLLFSMLLALLPDYFPSDLHCMAVSGVILLILITIAVHNLHNLPEKN